MYNLIPCMSILNFYHNTLKKKMTFDHIICRSLDL